MDCEYRQRLSAYHDGELPGAAMREMDLHVETCVACAAELEEIREVSRSFSEMAAEDLSSAAMARAHAVAEGAAAELGSPVLRVAGLLTALAASVLLVGSAWLREPPAGDGQPSKVAVAPAPAPEWERVAMTLDAGPIPIIQDTPDTPGRIILADAGRDARFANWVLQNLHR
jgi:anti-sigma factor RsiW